MKFRSKQCDVTAGEENPAFKQVPELWDFLNRENSCDEFQYLRRQQQVQGVPYYCLSQTKKTENVDYARRMCEGDEWVPFDAFYNEHHHSAGTVWSTVVVCDGCLKAIGVDPSQYDNQDDREYRLRNESDPDKLMMLSIGGLEEFEWRILYFRWYELMIKAGRWTDDWAFYVAPEGFPTNRVDRMRHKYMGAGNTDPDVFVPMTLGWYEGNGTTIKGRSEFRKWSQEWHNDRNRVTAGRMVERIYWLLGKSRPPTWDQVRSMRACVETVESLRRGDVQRRIERM